MRTSSACLRSQTIPPESEEEQGKGQVAQYQGQLDHVGFDQVETTEQREGREHEVAGAGLPRREEVADECRVAARLLAFLRLPACQRFGLCRIAGHQRRHHTAALIVQMKA